MLAKKFLFSVLVVLFGVMIVSAAVSNPGHLPSEIDWSQGVEGHLLVKGSAGNVDIWHGTSEGVIGTNTNTPLQIRTNDIPWIRITPTGEVGINSSSPATKLQIDFDSGTILTGTSALAGFHFDQVGGNDKFVGITTSATALDKASTQGGILFQGSENYGTKIHFLTTNAYASGMQQRMILDNLGNVGIGTAEPAFSLEIQKPAPYVGFVETDNGNKKWQVGGYNKNLVITEAGVTRVTVLEGGKLSAVGDVCTTVGGSEKCLSSTGTGGAVSFVGATSIAYNGQGVGGYSGGNSKCVAQFGAGAKMCTAGNFINALPNVEGWYSTFTYVYVGSDWINDCNGWTSSSSSYVLGPSWSVAMARPGNRVCSTVQPILCCR